MPIDTINLFAARTPTGIFPRRSRGSAPDAIGAWRNWAREPED